MQNDAIDHVKAQGFRVFMHDGNQKHAWLVYTDGTRLAVLSESRFGGYSVSTKHRPNSTTGTGFQIVENVELSRLSKQELECGFATAPYWAHAMQRASVRKWEGLASFLGSDSWNARYVEM